MRDDEMGMIESDGALDRLRLQDSQGMYQYQQGLSMPSTRTSSLLHVL